MAFPETNGAPDASGDDFLKSIGIDPSEGQPNGGISTPDTASGTPEQDAPAPSQFKFAGREYKTQADAEKAHKSLQTEFGTRSGRLKQLEALWQNPALRKAAMSDPQMAEALTRLGIAKAEERASQRGEPEVDDGEIDWTRGEARMDLIEARHTLDREMYGLERELKRDLSQDEKQQIMAMHGHLNGSGTLKNAWMLTDAYQTTIAETQRKALEAAQSKGGIQRPRPIPGVLPGQKLDLKKPVTDMNPTEWRESLRDQIRKTS